MYADSNNVLHIADATNTARVHTDFNPSSAYNSSLGSESLPFNTVRSRRGRFEELQVTGGGAVCTYKQSGYVTGQRIGSMPALDTQLFYAANVPGAQLGDMVQAAITSTDSAHRAFIVQGLITDNSGNMSIFASNMRGGASTDTGNTINLRWTVERYA
jgi:hypothetical protein